MMVIADTSPIQHLLLTQSVHVLPEICGVVYAPHAVLDELSDVGTPPAVREWFSNSPAWLRGAEPAVMLELHPKLGRDEHAAISLALERKHGVFLVIDDAKGRVLAEGKGIECIGTLGVHQAAANRGLFHFSEAIKRLRGTNMRLPQRFQ
jgi:predicted nucleic acid-binding protein